MRTYRPFLGKEEELDPPSPHGGKHPPHTPSDKDCWRHLIANHGYSESLNLYDARAEYKRWHE